MMKTGYKIIDAMTTRPITATPEMTLREAAKVMRDRGIGSLVLKRGDEFIGLVTEWDMIRRGMADSRDADSTPVAEVMTQLPDLVVVDPGMDIYDALRLMKEHDIRHLPVLDEGLLAGFVTMKDILRIQPALFDIIAERYELREAERKPIGRSLFRSGECELCKNYSEKLREVRGVVVCADCVNDVDE